MRTLALCLLISVAAHADERKATRYLEEALDRYHRTFDVYTEHNAAGNHFNVRARMSLHDDEHMPEAAARVVPAMDEAWTEQPHSGPTCIRATFKSDVLRGLPVWGAWAFRTEAPVNLTGAKELSFWARGERGGERIEFFVDSSPKAIRRVTLSKAWVRHSIPLAGLDLSKVAGGFGWSASAADNGLRDLVLYLDDVQYDLDHRDEPRFAVSFETKGMSDFDRVNRNAAHTYDNALVLLAFLAAGETQRAKTIADALLIAQRDDRARATGKLYQGSLRNAYQGGDLVRLPGWSEDGKWQEDFYAVSLDAGNMAWAMLALIAYHEVAAKSPDSPYLHSAQLLGNWIDEHCRTSLGYSGGFNGWEPSPEKAPYRSTEHNIDLYAAFERLSLITGDGKWHERAEHARAFVMKMWDETNGMFWTGMEGETVNRKVIPLDVQAWVVLALRDTLPRERAVRALAYADEHMRVDGGYDYSRRDCTDNGARCDDKRGVWYEGTAQMAAAWRYVGEVARERELVAAIAQKQASSGAVPSSNQKEGLPTGFVREKIRLAYFDRPHIGATAWYVFAARGVNPYWLGSRR